MTLEHQPSCADDLDAESLPLDAAREKILAAVAAAGETVELKLEQALGRVAAEDVLSNIAVPGHTNSAMDGYAVRFDDLNEAAAVELELIGEAPAGHPYAGTVSSGECVRIMTGGVMPAGSDTVVIQEHAERDSGTVRIGTGHRRGQNVRQAGEDIAVGDTVIKCGCLLTPAHLGLLASLGVPAIKTRRRLKACIFSTGDELRPVGTPLGEGELYDSNRYTLGGMLRRLGVEVTDLGVIKDDEKALAAAFDKAAHGYDAVITSGGVSVGEADYTKKIFARTGRIRFWKIAVKPGRPVAFGKLGDAAYFGLPGNPVSVVATFYILVQPALKKMMGLNEIAPLRLRARCTSALRKRPGRAEIQRGVLATDDDGALTVASTGAQGSGILSSVTAANCFIELPADAGTVEAGTEVSVIPFAGLV